MLKGLMSAVKKAVRSVPLATMLLLQLTELFQKSVVLSTQVPSATNSEPTVMVVSSRMGEAVFKGLPEMSLISAPAGTASRSVPGDVGVT